MLTSLFLFLFLIQIKHWYIDFVNQTSEEVANKGIYGNTKGLNHSIKHGFGTFIVVLAVTDFDYIVFSAIIGFIDFVAHYHIDWAKMNWGNRDIQNPKFWSHLGLDQMAHQFCYILLALLIFV